MRRREVDGELADIQKLLNMWGDRETMSATSSGVNRLKALAFRIGCCRAALDTKECPANVLQQRKAKMPRGCGTCQRNVDLSCDIADKYGSGACSDHGYKYWKRVTSAVA